MNPPKDWNHPRTGREYALAKAFCRVMAPAISEVASAPSGSGQAELENTPVFSG